MDIIINCLCTLYGCNGFGLIVATNADLNAWLKVASNITGVTCPACGCTQNLGNIGSVISQTDVSMPRIDGISKLQGRIGDTITISGHRLNYGSLIVSFGDIPASISSVTESSATVIVPPNTAGLVYTVSVSNENGQRQVGGALINEFTYLS